MEIMLEEVALALHKNGFAAHVAHSVDDAFDLVLDLIERESPKTVGLGSSMSLKTTGIYNLLKDSPAINCIDTAGIIKGLTEDPENEALRKQLKIAAHCDMFFCSANAIISNGQLINLDMVGNRTSMLAYGPERVVVIAGRNKIVTDLQGAVTRIKNVAAPLNARRLKLGLPCEAAGKCVNCNEPLRICNNWSITEKCFPKNRISVILVDANLGF